MPVDPVDSGTVTIRYWGAGARTYDDGVPKATAKESDDGKNEFPRNKCLPDLLWEQVRVQPNSTAVVYENETLTYRELAESSSVLAGYLKYLGVAPDDCVGMFAEPSIELIVGVWGILSSGGAYLPLSPEYPEERLRYMLETSRTKVIFSQVELRMRLAALAPQGAMIVTLRDATEFARLNSKAKKCNFNAGLRPSNLAYVIYTSGSTGKPKGVMIEHRSIVNQLDVIG